MPARDVPPLRLDAAKIEQVLNNLVRLAREEGGAVIYVSDEGPGVHAGELDRLFRPFSRTSVSASEGEKSTGLGLAIVRRIVEGHGGRVSAESAHAGSATYAVRLPARAPAGQTSPAAPALRLQ